MISCHDSESKVLSFQCGACVYFIQKMKHDFKKMEEEMDKLRENMSTITEFSEKITGTLQGKRQQITKLSGVHALLKKVFCRRCY